MATERAPAQYKQPSRKGKKAWRKHVDVSDVQAGLEDAREEDIKGGPLAERPSDALFTLDTTGSPAIRASVRNSFKPLRSDQILAQRSAVPSVSNYKRPAGVTDGVIEPRSKKHRSDGVNRKEYERLRQIAYGKQSVNDVIQKDNDTPRDDPWAPTLLPEAQDSQYDFPEKSRPAKAPGTMREEPKPLLLNSQARYRKQQPGPGTSYNPTLQDWNALITSQGVMEVEAEKKRLQQAEFERDLEERLAIAGRQEEQDLAWQSEAESAWEGFESDFDKQEWLAKKKHERKTPQEQKKAVRKKEREREEKRQRKEKERAAGEKRIMDIKAEVEAKAKEKLALAKLNSTDDDERDLMSLRCTAPRRKNIPEQHLEVVLPDELEDSLRRLRPEGNLLKDRYRDILLSGKMEARTPITQPKKARRKMTEKWTHKDFKVPIAT